MARALEGRRRADFGRLLLTSWLGFDFFLFLLRWRGGTVDGRLLSERKTLRHVLAIHKEEVDKGWKSFSGVGPCERMRGGAKLNC